MESNFINFIKRININDILDLFKGVIKKKKFININEYSNLSESDTDIYNENCAEYYYQLPIYVQKKIYTSPPTVV